MPKKFKIKYVKAYDYKVFLATGVYGGITGNGLINVNFITDRSVIPEFETAQLDDDDRQIGKPVPTKDSNAVREVQCGVMLDINTAKLIIAWLQDKINVTESFKNDSNEQG